MKATALFRHASASRKLVAGWLSPGALPIGRLSISVLSVGLLLLPVVASAKKSDRQQAMDYVSKSTEAFNAPNTVTTLTGSVKITQGTLLLTGNVAKIYLDADTQIARVVVTGSPAHIQQLDENNNLVQGDASTLDYDNINGIAVLTGNASVKQQGRGEFHGDKLTYNTDTSLITGESGGDGLVHGVILPKPKPAAPAAAAKPAAPASGTPTTPQGHP